jgi:hypothetical protein
MPQKLHNFPVTRRISWATIRAMVSRRKSFSPCSRLTFCLAALLFSGLAMADDKAGSDATVTSGGGGAVSPLSWQTNLGISGVARSPFVNDRDRDIGKVEALDSNFEVTGSYQANAGTIIRFGLEYQRNTYGLPYGSPLPDRLQAFHLALGSDLQLGEAWLVRVEAQPGFYGNDAGFLGRDFSCPLVAGGSYFVSADLQFVVGLSYDPDRRYPVLPGIGFRWKFAADWVLNVVPPTPRIEYSMTKTLMLYAGADLRDDTYRMGRNFGREHGIPELDGAVLDYAEVRVGAGAQWKISSAITMEIESGCVVVDQFDYHRDDIRFRSTEAPPYGGISLKAAF